MNTPSTKLACRMLVLQGERDYQVTMKDFGGWRRTLDGKSGGHVEDVSVAQPSLRERGRDAEPSGVRASGARR